MLRRKSISAIIIAATLLLFWGSGAAVAAAPMRFIDEQIAAHRGQTGVYVLDKGEEALLARAWLADNAEQSIDVQYFIWSTDNIGILAAEALLRAANRGVKVRIIVDDLLIDAPDESLLALAKHPRIDIRIYNPKSSVGVPLHKRVLNVFTDFRGVNQRMHDKTFIVDGRVAITGGRNMAAEYYDYNHEFNFRDRDALVVGEVVGAMRSNFARFWSSELSVPVERLYDGVGIMQKRVKVNDTNVQRIYAELQAYARQPANFAPEVRAAIVAAPVSFERLAAEMNWGNVAFIGDRPGKNAGDAGMEGGGLTTAALARLLSTAQNRVVIQSPYLVVSDEALELFKTLRARGVKIRISTNSLASTDNIQAFSGYRSQRGVLLSLGVEIYEYKPNPDIQRRLMHRLAAMQDEPPIFALHAKTLVVDSKVAFIGTFNFDPRSENLNTEVGVIAYNENTARDVEAAIEVDMLPANSWDAARDDPDQYVSWVKRSKVRFWQAMPIKPLL